LSYIVRAILAHDAWLRLVKRFGSGIKNHELTLRKRLLHIRKGNMNIHNYLKEFRILSKQLFAYGVKIGEEELQMFIFNGLSPSFDIFYTSVWTRGVTITLSKLKSLLVYEKVSKNDTIQEQENVMALIA
jgi:hypothetical protein